MVFTNTKDILEKVSQDYYDNDVEFNSEFLKDIEVKDINGNDLLDMYLEMQHDFNGDRVVRLRNLRYTDNKSKVAGTIIQLETEELNKGFSGNLLDILAGFENGKDSKVVRVDELITKAGSDETGLMVLFDFIF